MEPEKSITVPQMPWSSSEPQVVTAGKLGLGGMRDHLCLPGRTGGPKLSPKAHLLSLKKKNVEEEEEERMLSLDKFRMI